MTIPKVHPPHVVPPGLVERKDLIVRAVDIMALWERREGECLAAGLTGDMAKGPDGKTGGIATSKEMLPEALRARWAADKWQAFLDAARGRPARLIARFPHDGDVAACFSALPKRWQDLVGLGQRGQPVYNFPECERWVAAQLAKLRPPLHVCPTPPAAPGRGCDCGKVPGASTFHETWCSVLRPAIGGTPPPKPHASGLRSCSRCGNPCSTRTCHRCSLVAMAHVCAYDPVTERCGGCGSPRSQGVMGSTSPAFDTGKAITFADLLRAEEMLAAAQVPTFGEHIERAVAEATKPPPRDPAVCTLRTVERIRELNTQGKRVVCIVATSFRASVLMDRLHGVSVCVAVCEEPPDPEQRYTSVEAFVIDHTCEYGPDMAAKVKRWAAWFGFDIEKLLGEDPLAVAPWLNVGDTTPLATWRDLKARPYTPMTGEVYRVRIRVRNGHITFAGKAVRVVGPSSRIGEVDVTLVGDPSGQRYHYFPSELEELSARDKAGLAQNKAIAEALGPVAWENSALHERADVPSPPKTSLATLPSTLPLGEHCIAELKVALKLAINSAAAATTAGMVVEWGAPTRGGPQTVIDRDGARKWVGPLGQSEPWHVEPTATPTPASFAADAARWVEGMAGLKCHELHFVDTEPHIAIFGSTHGEPTRYGWIVRGYADHWTGGRPGLGDRVEVK